LFTLLQLRAIKGISLPLLVTVSSTSIPMPPTGWQQYGGYQQPGYGYEGQAAYPAQGYPGGGGQMMPGQHPGQPVEDEFELIEHSTPVDIEKLNRELFERNQELYDALDDARWTPFNPDKALPAVVKAAEENGTAVTA